MDSLRELAVESFHSAEVSAGRYPRVWLAIASYRNDYEVLQTLEKVQSLPEKIFDRILIVDSDGTGDVPRAIVQRGWRDISYYSYPVNLGSGANLRERLRIAAEYGAHYVYAINHDTGVDLHMVATLLQAAEKIENLGAAYPLAYFSDVGRYNLTGTRELPLSRRFVASVKAGPLIDVFWSSSNGALYSTEPAKQGVLPWGEMWMGFEDLEYGWHLSDHGFRQVIVRDAVFDDNSEYITTRLGHLTNKPPWRAYCFARNLIMAVRRCRRQPLFEAVTAYRMILEAALILFVRPHKLVRLRYFWLGIIDGIRGSGVRQGIP